MTESKKHKHKRRSKKLKDVDSDSNESCDGKTKASYQKGQCGHLQLIYIVAVVVWFVIIYVLKLYVHADYIQKCILAIPVLLFLVALISLQYITIDVESAILKTNFFTLSLFVALPLINLVKEDKLADRNEFVKLAVIAMIFSMLTLIDIWVQRKYLCLQQHVRSILQIFSIVLLIFAFYRYLVATTCASQGFHEQAVCPVICTKIC